MLEISDERIPLEATTEGVVRVCGTRIPLDSIVALFDEGASPEHIVEEFDTLELDDVYAVVTYYLRHRADVDAYLRERSEGRDAIRQELQARFPAVGLRDRLLARRRRQDASC